MSYSWAGFVIAPGAAVMVGELGGGHWQMPGRNRIRVLRAEDGVEIVAPADGGAKDFALVCGDPAVPRPRKA